MGESGGSLLNQEKKKEKKLRSMVLLVERKYQTTISLSLLSSFRKIPAETQATHFSGIPLCIIVSGVRVRNQWSRLC